MESLQAGDWEKNVCQRVNNLDKGSQLSEWVVCSNSKCTPWLDFPWAVERSEARVVSVFLFLNRINFVSTDLTLKKDVIVLCPSQPTLRLEC